MRKKTKYMIRRIILLVLLIVIFTGAFFIISNLNNNDQKEDLPNDDNIITNPEGEIKDPQNGKDDENKNQNKPDDVTKKEDIF